MLHSGGGGASRAEDAQGSHTQSHISPSILVYEGKTFEVVLSSLVSQVLSLNFLWEDKGLLAIKVMSTPIAASHMSTKYTPRERERVGTMGGERKREGEREREIRRDTDTEREREKERQRVCINEKEREREPERERERARGDTVTSK